MSNTSAIEISNLTFLRRYGFLRRETRTILENISLRIARGERVALLGANGTGKTTFLRLLAGVLQPTEGSIARFGQISTMLDPSYAMSDVLSPYENCRTRLILEGVVMSEIKSLIEQIELFADIGEYFRRPMNTLSSGMWARVAFSLMTSVPHEILLIDEGFGLADQSFRAKAGSRLTNIYQKADALVLASHDNVLLRSVCTRGVVLRSCSIEFDGEIEAAIAHYDSMNS